MYEKKSRLKRFEDLNGIRDTFKNLYSWYEKLDKLYWKEISEPRKSPSERLPIDHDAIIPPEKLIKPGEEITKDVSIKYEFLLKAVDRLKRLYGEMDDPEWKPPKDMSQPGMDDRGEIREYWNAYYKDKCKVYIDEELASWDKLEEMRELHSDKTIAIRNEYTEFNKQHFATKAFYKTFEKDIFREKRYADVQIFAWNIRKQGCPKYEACKKEDIDNKHSNPWMDMDNQFIFYH